MRNPVYVKRNLFLLVGLLLALLLNACAPAATPAAPAQPVAPTLPAPTQAAPTPTIASILVTDALGTEFRLERPAEKIISLAPSNTEILFAIGAGKQVIAREDFSNFPLEATELPSVGGSMGKYNLEQIASLQPDLILASPLTAGEALQSLKEITPNVVVVGNPQTLDEMYANLLLVGRLTGRLPEAETLVTDLRARAQAVLAKVATATSQPTVFYELDATDPAKPWTAGAGTFIDMLIGLAGGQNIGASLQGEWAQISQEELIVQNPDIILLGDSTYGGVTAAQVAERPGWDAIAAVKNNQVFEFNDDLVSRPGPRQLDGLEALAKAIHPELFK